MSDIAYDWIALGVAAFLFAVLSFLKRKKNAGFTTRVLLATVFGIILGIAFKGHTDYVGAVGSIWSNAITALVVPLLLFSIISSITNLGESIRLKNIGAKTVFFLLLNTAMASLLTLILSQAFQLGRGFHYTLPSDYKQHDVPAVLDTIVNLFPHNIADSWANNQVVPIVLFAILTALAYNAAASTDKGRSAVAPFKTFIDAGNVVFSKATQIVVGFTPYAVLSLISEAVSGSDVSTLLPLILALVVAYIAIVLQLFLVQPLVLAAVTKLNPIHFFKAFFPAGVVAFTSESSIGTIPVTVRQLRSAGVPGDIASFVAGLGANLGMPGCAGVWPMLLAVFAVHAQGLNYSPAQYLFLVVLTLLVSIGTVGVPGTATITATSLFAAAGLPIPFIAISQPISQIVDMGRTALNVAGAANTAVIVAQTEHQLDADLYYGRKEYSDDFNDGERFRQTAMQALTGTEPSQRANITNDAKSDSANVSQQQSGFTLHFAPNAVLSASGDDACCGTKPNK